MPLAVGSKIGPYEILATLGAGGMGEVYRARDTKLKRDVALKVLPDIVARDPERMARFQREAEVLASLNHPNIAQIYGVQERALVMELVEGNAPRGPLPFEGAWRVAAQIAAALAYAHEKGIVHRDLKPANVKVSPEGIVKLLDFGLAKILTAETPPSSGADSTVTMSATREGIILGTAAYMAPEQARNAAIDKRADIWAFGVVLYELLAGERLFKGKDWSETLANVLAKQLDFDRVPAKARRLLRDCLERDPAKRLRDIGDAERLIVEDAPVVTHRRRALLAGWVAAAMMLTAFAAVSLIHFGERPHEEPLTQFSVDLGPDALLGPRTTVALSRDGRRFVFPTKNGLATRRLEEAAAALLPGTSGAEDPFFSPDGEWIAFFADQKLKKVAVRSGAVVTLCDSPGDRGGSWGDDGNIVFQTSGSINSPLLRVSAQGGVPQPISRFGPGDVTHRWPQVLPGASAVLFTNATQPANYDTANLDVMSLPSGRRKTVVRGGYYGRYVPETTGGYLVYIREGTLFGVQFDASRLETRGTPAPLIENVASDTRSGSAQLDISNAGVLVYQPGKSGQGQDMGWLDGTGQSTPVLTKPGLIEPRFSPDGKRMAYHRPGNKARDVWIYDIAQDTHTQLTFTAAGTTHIAWAPDSEHLVYGAGSPPWNLWWIRADGSGRPQSLLTAESPLWPQSFTPDGRLAFIQGTGDIFTLPVDWSDPEHPKAGQPQAFLTTPALEPEASFSTDARWIAYQSNESGQPDLFVRPFPGPGTKYRISTDGGQFPVWSRKARQILYSNAEGVVMVVEYATSGGNFQAGKPRPWSAVKVLTTGSFPSFDLHPDGRRMMALLMPKSNASPSNLHANFLLNFTSDLRRVLVGR